MPAEIDAGSLDIRRLGVAVERLVLHDANLWVEVAHDDAGLTDGFHQDEHSHRWTNGLAGVPEALVRPFSGAFALEVHLATACSLGYRPPASDVAKAAA